MIVLVHPYTEETEGERLVYTMCMKREEIKTLMLSKGFRLEKTTKSYPARRGEEDIYTRKPEYKYTFRVSLVNDNEPYYGLYVGIGDQFKQIDAMIEHDVNVSEVWSSSGKPLPMWTGDNLRALLDYFS